LQALALGGVGWVGHAARRLAVPEGHGRPCRSARLTVARRTRVRMEFHDLAESRCGANLPTATVICRTARLSQIEVIPKLRMCAQVQEKTMTRR